MAGSERCDARETHWNFDRRSRFDGASPIPTVPYLELPDGRSSRSQPRMRTSKPIIYCVKNYYGARVSNQELLL